MPQTHMAQEAADCARVIQAQLYANQTVCESLAATLRQAPPTLVYMIGRGSSDHAGVFGKYLIEIEMQIPVCAAAPSVTSVYGKRLRLDGALAICISQSGRSPDILTQANAARQAGALLVALVNDDHSPLAQLADTVIPLHAGTERAVAATKSYLASLSALLQLVACWKQDEPLQTALRSLPQALQQAVLAPAQLSAETIAPLRHCVVLGRGFGYAIGREIALKLKEVCGVHAESFSSAEFLHGPVTLVADHLRVIDLDIDDESADTHREQIAAIRERGGQLIRLAAVGAGLHPRLAPLTLLQRFYLDIERIAVSMGRDPDAPVGLSKVTQTL